MKERKHSLNDPFFNEFVYHCIVNAPHELINKLPTKLLQCTYSKERIKLFADKASREAKDEMLARLGIEHATFYSIPEYLNTDEIKTAYRNYKEENRLTDVNTMIARKQFVYTSREVMAILNVMAHNCHHPTYMLNREYATIATEIVQMKKIDRKVRDIELVKSVMEDHKMICKLLMFNLMNQNIVDTLTAYTAKELLILLFLFLRYNGQNITYTPLKTICDHFQTVYNRRVISTTLLGLYRARHIDMFPRRQDYAISGLGIQVLGSYLSRLINNTLTR